MNETNSKIANKKEACKTYIEQTKLLVTLSSAFIIAPAALFSFIKDDSLKQEITKNICKFVTLEVLFIASVLSGYVVLATIAGSQAEGKFDVYRPATRIFSFVQIGTYLFGLGYFVSLVYNMFQ
jgi:hypothetical protein